MSLLSEIIAKNRASHTVAIASVCSAQPDVLQAAILLAGRLNKPVLIKATSNQVNQFGGYTGMKPIDFIALVTRIASDNRVDPALIHFGGDHLGPQVWRTEPAKIAMPHASKMMRAYVEAGFTKIHLDCSEGCAGEPAQVDDTTSAERSAELAAICEQYAPDPEKLSYVIGTEVPPPGGARAEEAGQGTLPTNADHARHTLECHSDAFAARRLSHVWPRIIGLVVQPGLEFAPTHLDHFDMTAPNLLSTALSNDPHICFEAHSTDYQRNAVYPELARRNFAVLKVGPALTFAYRQALYALDHMREHLAPASKASRLLATVESLMLAEPSKWNKHYAGSETELYQQRHFSYADRIRYYWPEQKAQSAIEALFDALETPPPMRPLLEQYFDEAVINTAVSLKDLAGGWAKALVIAQIQRALMPYFFEK